MLFFLGSYKITDTAKLKMPKLDNSVNTHLTSNRKGPL